MVQLTARYSPSLRLVYLNNPKAACSTIKASLWEACDEAAGTKTYSGNPHHRQNDPFIKNPFLQKDSDVSSLKTATFFSAVRNPFVRILSAYLDKVGRDAGVWLPFVRRFGIRNSVTRDELSFRDFLAILTTEQDELLNPHFRPQYLNLLWPVCRPHFVGRMENLSDVFDFLSQHNIRVVPSHEHATGSRELVKRYYSADTVELVRAKYATDFSIFGYSTDITHIDEFASIGAGVGGCEPLVQWITNNEFPYELVDYHSQEFERFQGLRSRDAKLEIASKAFRTDDNWNRIQKYAGFALHVGEYALAQEGIARIVVLQGNHYSLVRNASIFIDRPLAG